MSGGSLSITLSVGGVEFCLSPSESSESSDAYASTAPITSVRRLPAADAADGPPAKSSTGKVEAVYVADLAGFTGTLRVSLSASASATEGGGGGVASVPSHQAVVPRTQQRNGHNSDGDGEGVHQGAHPAAAQSRERRDSVSSSTICTRKIVPLEDDAVVSKGAQTEEVQADRVEFESQPADVAFRSASGSNRGAVPPDEHGGEDAPTDEDDEGFEVPPESPFRDEDLVADTNDSAPRGKLKPADGASSPPERLRRTVNWSDVLSSEMSTPARGLGGAVGGALARAQGQSNLLASPFQKLLSERYIDPDVPPPASAAAAALRRDRDGDRPFRRIVIAKVLAHRRRLHEQQSQSLSESGRRRLHEQQSQSLSESEERQGLVLPRGAIVDAPPDVGIVYAEEGTPLSSEVVFVTTPGGTTTALHRACADPAITLRCLRSVLEADPDAASVPDASGRLPLHVLAENEAILEYPRRREDVGSTFVRDLLDVYPTGIIEADHEGNIPLVSLVRRWIENTYRTAAEEEGVRIKAESEGGMMASLASPSHHLSRLGYTRNAARGKRSSPARPNRPAHGRNDSDNDDASSGGNGNEWSPPLSGEADTDEYDGLFPEVFVPPIVEWTLVMLSLALDNLGGPLGRERGTRLEQLHSRGELAERIASVHPLFLQTLLLIDDDETRNRILELSIVRRAMLHASSVDWWIIRLLQRESGSHSGRVVDYFGLVSQLDVSDLIGKDRAPKGADFDAFHGEKLALFEAIRSYRDILPSLLILPEKELENVSRSRVVWQMVDDTISRPFVISIVVIDFVLHLTLLFAFRMTLRNSGYTGESPERYPPPSASYMIGILAAHQLVRKISQGGHLYSISPSVFKSFLSDHWTWIDVASIVLVWASISAPDETNSAQLAVAMALLWLRLLSLLKAMNMHLATYILSVTQIVKDIRWYLVLLTCILLMFADMIQILTAFSKTAAGGSYCTIDFDDEESRTREDFCSQNIVYSYFRMYGVLVGDFDIDDYRTMPAIAFLFVLFTFIGVIVLLNVFIAIVSDSYEKSRIRSAFLFGRARVSFATEHLALESFLVQSMNLKESIFGTESFLRFWKVIGRWFVFVTLLGTAVAADAFIYAYIVFQIQEGAGGEHIFFIIFTSILAVILNWAIFDVFLFVIRAWTCTTNCCQGTCSSAESLCGRAQPCLLYPVKLCSRFLPQRLFGVTTLWLNNAGNDAESEDWEGRLGYMIKQTSNIVRESEFRIHEKVKESEKVMKDYDRTVKIELQKDISNVLKAVANSS